jgi:hypothetical protein
MAARTTWNHQRIAAVKSMCAAGMSVEAVADNLGLSVAAVYQGCYRHGINLKDRSAPRAAAQRKKAREAQPRVCATAYKPPVPKNADAIRPSLGRPTSLTAALMGDPLPGRTPRAQDY